MVMARTLALSLAAAIYFHCACSERVDASVHMAKMEAGAENLQLDHGAGQQRQNAERAASHVQLQEEEPGARSTGPLKDLPVGLTGGLGSSSGKMALIERQIVSLQGQVKKLNGWVGQLLRAQHQGSMTSVLQHQPSENRSAQPGGLAELAGEADSNPDASEKLDEVIKYQSQWMKMKFSKSCVNTRTGQTVSGAVKCEPGGWRAKRSDRCCCKTGWKRKQGHHGDYDFCSGQELQVLHKDQPCPKTWSWTHTEECYKQGGLANQCCCVANYVVAGGKCIKFKKNAKRGDGEDDESRYLEDEEDEYELTQGE